jgi:hypothetical protein
LSFRTSTPVIHAMIITSVSNCLRLSGSSDFRPRTGPSPPPGEGRQKQSMPRVQQQSGDEICEPDFPFVSRYTAFRHLRVGDHSYCTNGERLPALAPFATINEVRVAARLHDCQSPLPAEPQERRSRSPRSNG